MPSLPTTSLLHLPTSTRSLTADISHLQNSLPIPPHSQIAIYQLPTHLHLPLYIALYERSCTPIYLNDRWSHQEVLQALSHLHIDFIILPPHKSFPSSHPQIHLFRDKTDTPQLSITTPLHPIPPSSLPPPPSIFFTSGTTSTPKAVKLSAEAIVTQALIKHCQVGFSSQTIYLHLAPFYHVGGHSSALSITLTNGTHIFPPSHFRPSTHSSDLLHYAQRKHVNTLVVVPSILQLLIDTHLTCTNITTIFYGAAKLTPQLLRQARLQFPNANLIGAYGMTETSSSISFLHHNKLSLHSPHHRSVGRPPAHIQVRIDETGEILTKGPHVMTGYIGSKVCKGWFRTGDIGYMDDGYLYITGRRKDMIKTGGENVFAAEVEEALLACSDVREAAVVGVPHRVLGEAIAAAVVVNNSVKFRDAMEELHKVCKQCLTPFKRPRWIVQQAQLPKNDMGKVLKDVLRERVARSIFPVGKL